MRQPTTDVRASWFLLNLKQAELRVLAQRGGGPSVRTHISAARILPTPGRLLISIIDTEAPAVRPLRDTHERFGQILAANRLEEWVTEHAMPVGAEGLDRDSVGLLTRFRPDGKTVLARHFLAVEEPSDSQTVKLRPTAHNGGQAPAGRWWLEFRHGGRHVLIDQWASTTVGDVPRLLGHTLERLRLLSPQLPDWPVVTITEPTPEEGGPVDDIWFVFHKRELRVNAVSMPRTNPYRNPVLLLGHRTSLPPHVTVCETTHAWFDAHEISTGSGASVRGDVAHRFVTSATDPAAAEALLSVLRENEFLISVVVVHPTPHVAARPAPTFCPDLVLGLAPEAEVRGGIPVLPVPIVERPVGGYGVPGQTGLLGWRGSEEEGTALLVAVAHPNGQRYVFEYLIRVQGGEFLHDVLLTLARVAERLGFHDVPHFGFADVPAYELEMAGLADTAVDNSAASDAMVGPDDTDNHSFACQQRTFKRARALLPAEDEDRPIGQSRAELLHVLDELVQSVMRDPDEHSRISRLLRAYHVAADDLIGARLGRLVTSLIVAELCIEALHPVASASPGPRERADLERLHMLLFATASPVDVFTDALTSFLRAQVTDHARTRARGVSRILNLVGEWLAGEQVRPHQAHMSLDARSLTANQLFELRELVRRAPWLAWYVTYRTGPRRFRIRLDHTAFLEVLGLTRPRTQYMPGANSAASNPGNWRSISGQLELFDLLDRYVIDDEVAACLTDEPRLLDDLARACEVMYHLPWQARQAVQSLTELGPIAGKLDALAARGADLRIGSLDDVSVLIDAPGRGLAPRVCLVNANGTRRCQVILGEEARFSLAEYAVAIPDATSYTTSPYTLAPDAQTVTVRDGLDERSASVEARTHLDRGSGADSEWIDPTLFRGRHEQLTQILGTIHPSSGVRVPVAVYGPRGAGKTTLAVHACRQGMSRGWLSGFTKVDLFEDPVDSEGEAYLDSLTQVLIDKATQELGLAIAGSPADPAAVLDEIDRAASLIPVGIILDEFDRLLSHAADSPLQRLAVRLGGKRWQNLTVIATIQRFYKNAAELETWQLIGCPADLSWRDGVTYFAQPLLEVEQGRRVIGELPAPVVLPGAFRDFVHRRLGLRPYFWGRLRRRLESELLMTGGYAVADIDALELIIDGFIDENQYLGQPLQESDGMSLSEARRRDLFTVPEKRVLACFATSERKRLEVSEAVRVGGPHAVRELQERAYAAIYNGQVQLAVPLFGEYLRAHAIDFEEFLVSELPSLKMHYGTPRAPPLSFLCFVL